jgi:hypothetical protein
VEGVSATDFVRQFGTIKTYVEPTVQILWEFRQLVNFVQKRVHIHIHMPIVTDKIFKVCIMEQGTALLPNFG